MFFSLSAGGTHALALRSDGTVACFGDNDDNQAPAAGMPGPYVAIAAGSHHSLALKANGEVDAWGLNDNGQCTVPAAGAAGFVGIAAGGCHSLAVRPNGDVVCFGSNSEGQAPPAGFAGAKQFSLVVPPLQPAAPQLQL